MGKVSNQLGTFDGVKETAARKAMQTNNYRNTERMNKYNREINRKERRQKKNTKETSVEGENELNYVYVYG